MNVWMTIWHKKSIYRRTAERYLFPVLLFLYPLLQINQGIDISDTTYSLGNYRFMDALDPMWIFATYLANLTGSLLMKLPFGDTLLFFNLYTGLLVSATALLGYFFLRKYMPAAIVFVGEMIALGLCWCPTTILYNYLTYLLLAAGTVLLIYGLLQEKRRFLILAGVCLGLNVMVRFSNLPQAALILVVWFAGFLWKKKGKETLRDTLFCLLGYLAGIGVIMVFLVFRYGPNAYFEMIGGLFGITEEASDYTLLGMLSAIWDAYQRGFEWLFYMIPCGAAGMVMFYVKKGKWEKLKKAAYVGGILVLLRFYLGQGMFTLRYYDYEAVFQWMMLFLILSLAAALAGAGGFMGGGRPFRLFGAAVAVLIVITPIGSNNYTFQNMNNLFLVAPYTLWALWRLYLRTRKNVLLFPWQSFAATIVLMTLVQSFLFGMIFVFRDGTLGEPRTAQVEGSSRLAGMYTNRENAESLTELIQFWEGEGATFTEALFWGDAPGLSYILDTPSAIFTSWPEIPSNTYDALSKALAALTNRPPILLHNETGKELAEGEKSELILTFIEENSYQLIFENNNYKVYLAQNAQAKR